MRSLDRYLDIASEEIEADLARWHPALELGDLTRWPSRLTHRKLTVLLDHLPEESAWKTWIRDNVTVRTAQVKGAKDDENEYKGQPWNLLNRQVQGLRNDIHLGFYQLAAALGGGDTKDFELPYTTPRVKIEAEEEAQTTADGVISLEERRAMLEQVRRNRGWSSLRT